MLNIQNVLRLRILPLPHVEESIEELKYALDELKLDGVGLLSNYNGHFLGDPIFDELMDELNKRNAVVFIHPSAPVEASPRARFLTADFMAEFTFNTTRAAANLVLSGTIDVVQILNLSLLMQVVHFHI